eukprot:15439889-Alexandrium_andersonii.AAC.1
MKASRGAHSVLFAQIPNPPMRPAGERAGGASREGVKEGRRLGGPAHEDIDRSQSIAGSDHDRN